jgi:transposase
MYENVVTMCWSIREVNKNLQDRESMTDYSIEYLKKACSDLAKMISSGKNAELKEEIEVVNRAGEATKFTLGEVAEMLGDAKKIIEFNLIDHVDQWAKSKTKNVPSR